MRHGKVSESCAGRGREGFFREFGHDRGRTIADGTALDSELLDNPRDRTAL